MKKSILVGDSGGTKTDWCFVDEHDSKRFFTSKSFHPSNFGSAFFEEIRLYWGDKVDLKSSEVHFYGAGCLSQTNKDLLQNYFEGWGFSNVKILSDVEGACHALLGNEKGTIAILGTGSVVCEFDGSKITQMIGGLGYLIGDEGSGYYFGKIFIQAYLTNTFSLSTMKELFPIFGERSEVLKNVYGTEGKSFLSSISEILSERFSGNEEVLNLHKMNFELFVKRHFSDRMESKKNIAILGSYGYHQKEILSSVLQKSNIEISQCIQYPIVQLTDYILRDTL
jgi:glucosamine kinase